MNADQAVIGKSVTIAVNRGLKEIRGSRRDCVGVPAKILVEKQEEVGCFRSSEGFSQVILLWNVPA